MSMKHLLILGAFSYSLTASTIVHAQAGGAPCGSFHKLPNGNWSVVNPVKIEHENSSAMLSKGTIIGPGTRVSGVDIFAALNKSCH